MVFPGLGHDPGFIGGEKEDIGIDSARNRGKPGRKGNFIREPQGGKARKGPLAAEEGNFRISCCLQLLLPRRPDAKGSARVAVFFSFFSLRRMVRPVIIRAIFQSASAA
jgi:hypothetical protein